MTRERVVCAVVGLAAAVLTAGAVLLPVIEAHTHPLAGWLRIVYAPVCHQQPDRCLQIGGAPMAVCARCLGLYAGGTLALLAAALGAWRSPRALLAAAVAVNAADVLLGFAGLPSSSNGLRVALGGVLGITAGLVAAEGLRDVVGLRSASGLRYPGGRTGTDQQRSDTL